MATNTRHARRPWNAQQRDDLCSAAPGAFAAAPSVVAAWLFGSAEHADEVGDVDIALFYVPGAPPSMGELGSVMAALTEVIGPAGPGVDLRTVGRDMTVLAHEVHRTGRLLFERDRETRIVLQADFESRYLDERWLATLAAEAAAERRRAT